VASNAPENVGFSASSSGRSLSQNLYRPKPQRFNVEPSYLDLAEEDTPLVPADIAAVIYASSQKPPQIAESLIKRAMSADTVGLSERIAEALEWFRADHRRSGNNWRDHMGMG
jgi:hypothetical protein